VAGVLDVEGVVVLLVGCWDGELVDLPGAA
jgi:hypothetical protein